MQLQIVRYEQQDYWYLQTSEAMLLYTLRYIALSFLPRDAMRKRGLCYRLVSVCASVCHVGVGLLYPDG